MTDPGNIRPTRHPIVQLLTWPAAWLLDRNDRPATAKVMAFLILAAFWRGHPIPAVVVLALLSAAFGYTAWKDFIATSKSSLTGNETLDLAGKFEKTVTQTVESHDH